MITHCANSANREITLDSDTESTTLAYQGISTFYLGQVLTPGVLNVHVRDRGLACWLI